MMNFGMTIICLIHLFCLWYQDLCYNHSKIVFKIALVNHTNLPTNFQVSAFFFSFISFDLAKDK